MKKRIIITGITGFIGSELARSFASDEWEVVGLSRNPASSLFESMDCIKIYRWDGITSEGWAKYAENAEAIINLAGENIGDGIWTKNRKNRIVNSRLNSIIAIKDAIRNISSKPKVFIQASAIGYYGSQNENILEENSPPGNGFLANICREIENSILEIAGLGIRTIVIRSGIVLGKSGFLSKIKPFSNILPIIYFGDGANWISWIHIEDEVSAIKYLSINQVFSGVFNLVSPNPIIASEFYKEISKALGKRRLLKIPSFLIRKPGGAFARELLLSSQRVIPINLLKAGYSFIYPKLAEGLRSIF